MTKDPMDPDTLDWTLLARYLGGACSAAEAEAVRQALAADPRREAEVARLRRVFDLAGELPTGAETDALWGRVAREAGLESAGRGGRSATVTPLFAALPEARPRRRWARWLMGLAAVVVLGAGAALAFRFWRMSAGMGDGTGRVAAQEFRTPRGQRGAMTLMDGTRVALGPESSMRVTMGESGPRAVELQGEAVFEVVHDPARPFVVRAGGTVAEDLGTTFAVRAYAGEPVRVVVAEGVVAVADTAARAAPTVLEPRDLALVAADGTIRVQRDVDPTAYVAWKDGRLVFRRARLRDVVPQLERWFDIRIVVEDPTLQDASVYASVGEVGVDQVLRTIAASLGAQVERRGRTVRLYRSD
jgi:transmembrane sensor